MHGISEGGARLGQAIAADLAAYGCAVQITPLSRRDWASATFAGERVRFGLYLSGVGATAAADALVGDLPEREFDLGGAFVAEIVAVLDERTTNAVRLIIEALIVDAG
jgi:hypothetical protein